MFMKKLIDYIARQVWNQVGISLTEGITQKESLKVVYKILSELAGEELAEEFITNLLEAEEEKKSDAPEEGEGDKEGSKIVNDFFNKMANTEPVMIFFKKISERQKPQPKAEAIVRFAEMIGIPKGKIASIIADIKDVSKKQ